MSRQNQRGISMLGLLLLLLVVAFVMLTAFKLAPIYAENRYVVTGLRSLASDGESLRAMSASEIRGALKRYYTINGVRSEGPKNIEVERHGRDHVLVKVDYEVRENFLYNVDVVVVFRNHLDSARFDECCSAQDIDER